MSADKHRGIRRQKQKRAKERKKQVQQPHPPAGNVRKSPAKATERQVA